MRRVSNTSSGYMTIYSRWLSFHLFSFLSLTLVQSQLSSRPRGILIEGGGKDVVNYQFHSLPHSEGVCLKGDINIVGATKGVNSGEAQPLSQ